MRITIQDAINHPLWKEIEETKKDEEYDIFDMDDFSNKLANDINNITLTNLQNQNLEETKREVQDFSPLTPPTLIQYPFKKKNQHSFETTTNMIGLIDKYYEDNYFIKPDEEEIGTKPINIVEKNRVSDKICGFLKNSYEIMISSLGFKTV
jgi:hypothetical protein